MTLWWTEIPLDTAEWTPQRHIVLVLSWIVASAAVNLLVLAYNYDYVRPYWDRVRPYVLWTLWLVFCIGAIVLLKDLRQPAMQTCAALTTVLWYFHKHYKDAALSLKKDVITNAADGLTRILGVLSHGLKEDKVPATSLEAVSKFNEGVYRLHLIGSPEISKGVHRYNGVILETQGHMGIAKGRIERFRREIENADDEIIRCKDELKIASGGDLEFLSSPSAVRMIEVILKLEIFKRSRRSDIAKAVGAFGNWFVTNLPSIVRTHRELILLLRTELDLPPNDEFLKDLADLNQNAIPKVTARFQRETEEASLPKAFDSLEGLQLTFDNVRREVVFELSKAKSSDSKSTAPPKDH